MTAAARPDGRGADALTAGMTLDLRGVELPEAEGVDAAEEGGGQAVRGRFGDDAESRCDRCAVDAPTAAAETRPSRLPLDPPVGAPAPPPRVTEDGVWLGVATGSCSPAMKGVSFWAAFSGFAKKPSLTSAQEGKTCRRAHKFDGIHP